MVDLHNITVWTEVGWLTTEVSSIHDLAIASALPATKYYLIFSLTTKGLLLSGNLYIWTDGNLIFTPSCLLVIYIYHHLYGHMFDKKCRQRFNL